jgi:hypothetical protein
MKGNPFLFLLGMLVFCGGCEYLAIQSPASDPEAVFDEVWNFVDREYSLFAFKNVDWDERYDHYRELIDSEMDDDSLLNVIGAMLNELEDRHVNACSATECSSWEWTEFHPENVKLSLLKNFYWLGNEEKIGPLRVVDFGDVGYLYLNTFAFEPDIDEWASTLDRFRDHQGIILDIRNNGGGDLDTYRAIAGLFTEETRLVGEQRYKTGPGRDDFSEWEQHFISPSAPGRAYTKPVVLLINHGTYSSATFFANAMSRFSNVTLVGDATGGGGGVPAYTELANGWWMRCSNTQFKDPDEYFIDMGVLPDIEIDMDTSLIDQGIDSILEEGLELLR